MVMLYLSTGPLSLSISLVCTSLCTGLWKNYVIDIDYADAKFGQESSPVLWWQVLGCATETPRIFRPALCLTQMFENAGWTQRFMGTFFRSHQKGTPIVYWMAAPWVQMIPIMDSLPKMWLTSTECGPLWSQTQSWVHLIEIPQSCLGHSNFWVSKSTFFIFASCNNCMQYIY